MEGRPRVSSQRKNFHVQVSQPAAKRGCGKWAPCFMGRASCYREYISRIFWGFWQQQRSFWHQWSCTTIRLSPQIWRRPKKMSVSTNETFAVQTAISHHHRILMIFHEAHSMAWLRACGVTSRALQALYLSIILRGSWCHQVETRVLSYFSVYTLHCQAFFFSKTFQYRGTFLFVYIYRKGHYICYQLCSHNHVDAAPFSCQLCCTCRGSIVVFRR